MKKVLFIVVAVMLVAGCGQRRAAKSQESQQEATPAETEEVVEHKCCGHHGEGDCPSEKLEKACDHASQKIEDACDQIEKAADTAEEAAEQTESKGVTVVQLGKKQGRKPIKPVPIPKK